MISFWFHSQSFVHSYAAVPILGIIIRGYDMSIDLENDSQSKVLIEISGIYHNVFTKLKIKLKVKMIHVYNAQCYN